ncbi:hypothetical protein [Terribacillus sp. JSM ZJ617]|uniref:hypothetical protein n=1 Tax=Terribacillus sp. JSM ZJ617 TaxID=3342119 RepID=UPI0035A86938
MQTDWNSRRTAGSRRNLWSDIADHCQQSHEFDHFNSTVVITDDCKGDHKYCLEKPQNNESHSLIIPDPLR